MFNNSTKVEQQFHSIGFKVLIVFAVLICAIMTRKTKNLKILKLCGCDSGVGIPYDILASIFSAFAQADDPINIRAVKHTRKQFTDHILEVEDNDTNKIVAQQTFTSYGLQVGLAKDRQQGINALEHLDYDWVFMDLCMPNIDGFEACLLIRQKNPDIPIVVLIAIAVKGEVKKH